MKVAYAQRVPFFDFCDKRKKKITFIKRFFESVTQLMSTFKYKMGLKSPWIHIIHHTMCPLITDNWVDHCSKVEETVLEEEDTIMGD